MTELVYGTLTALIAIAGIEVAGGATPTGAGAVVLVGAAATWLAHAYAGLLGRRAAVGHPESGAQVGHALRRAWPILLAAIPSVVALGGASLGLWSSLRRWGFERGRHRGARRSGIPCGPSGGAPMGGRLTSAVITASIGAGIVAVERLHPRMNTPHRRHEPETTAMDPRQGQPPGGAVRCAARAADAPQPARRTAHHRQARPLRPNVLDLADAHTLEPRSLRDGRSNWSGCSNRPRRRPR